MEITKRRSLVHAFIVLGVLAIPNLAFSAQLHPLASLQKAVAKAATLTQAAAEETHRAEEKLREAADAIKIESERNAEAAKAALKAREEALEKQATAKKNAAQFLCSVKSSASEQRSVDLIELGPEEDKRKFRLKTDSVLSGKVFIDVTIGRTAEEEELISYELIDAETGNLLPEQGEAALASLGAEFACFKSLSKAVAASPVSSRVDKPVPAQEVTSPAPQGSGNASSAQ